MKSIPRVITTEQLIKSQKKTELVCGFYGHEHPKCKKAVQKDTALYMNFLKQFKVDDDEEISKVNNNE